MAGGGLLIAGCGAAGSSSTSSGADAGTAHSVARAAAPVPENGAGTAAGQRTALTALAGQDIIYTSSLTVRTADVSRAAARASQLATAAGGYVSAESTALDRAHPANSTVRIQLKIPVAGYPATLSALSALGTRISVSERAQDVTQTVADVASRVTSASTAIAQLRALLRRAGSVSSLLTVQNQINQEESDLESLLSQQRVLRHQTAFATVTLLLVSKRRPAAAHHRTSAGGFTSGLAAGWHGLRVAVSVLLTGVGAALPFAALLALAGYLAYRGRRWLVQRRAPRPSAAE